MLSSLAKDKLAKVSVARDKDSLFALSNIKNQLIS
jgi:hypothetical protein